MSTKQRIRAAETQRLKDSHDLQRKGMTVAEDHEEHGEYCGQSRWLRGIWTSVESIEPVLKERTRAICEKNIISGEIPPPVKHKNERAKHQQHCEYQIIDGIIPITLAFHANTSGRVPITSSGTELAPASVS